MLEFPPKYKYILLGSLLLDALFFILAVVNIIDSFLYLMGIIGIFLISLATNSIYGGCYLIRLVVIGKQIKAGLSQETNKKIRVIRLSTSLVICVSYAISLILGFSFVVLILLGAEVAFSFFITLESRKVD